MGLALAMFCLLAGSILVLLWIIHISRVRMNVNKMPGPPPTGLVGNVMQFKRGGADFMDQITFFSALYGCDTGMYRVWLSHHMVVVITKAEQAEALLTSSKLITKSHLYNFLLPWLGTGLLTSTGEKWQSRRKMLTPSFHFKILNDFLHVFNEQAAIMADRLEDRVGRGTFDMTQYITLCALDIICDTAMGKHVNAQSNSESKYVKAIYRISELIMDRIKSPWLWPNFIFNLTSAGREHNNCLAVLHNFTNSVIRERRDASLKQSRSNASVAAPAAADAATRGSSDLNDETRFEKKRLAFLDLLLEAEGSERLTVSDLREEVDTFMFEGHDTTAAAANWAVHLIGEHPVVQARLQEELDQIFGASERPATMEDIKKLKYMECVIKETLRLFPSVPIFAREITEDCKIDGYSIPKGSTGVVLVCAIHKDRKYFPDPEKFDPDRWLPENSTGRHPFCFVPFSAGMRNCIGQKFAMIEEKVLLTYILRRFNIRSALTREELRPNAELILRAEAGIIVSLTKRNEQMTI